MCSLSCLAMDYLYLPFEYYISVMLFFCMNIRTVVKYGTMIFNQSLIFIRQTMEFTSLMIIPLMTGDKIKLASLRF